VLRRHLAVRDRQCGDAHPATDPACPARAPAPVPPGSGVSRRGRQRFLNRHRQGGRVLRPPGIGVRGPKPWLGTWRAVRPGSAGLVHAVWRRRPARLCGTDSRTVVADRPGSADREHMQRTSREWDESYLAPVTPPWDIGAVQPALAAHLQGLELADPVLDAGCGTGEVAIYLARHGHQVHGLDISPEAITRARAKASAQRVAVDFRVADARHLAGEKLHPGAVVD